MGNVVAVLTDHVVRDAVPAAIPVGSDRENERVFVTVVPLP